MHLKQPGFTYSACGLFTKNKERIQKFKETGDIKYIYRNELDKACFLHDIAYGDFKDLARITAPAKPLRDKAFNIAKSSEYDGFEDALLLWFINFLIKSRKILVLLHLQIMYLLWTWLHSNQLKISQTNY